MLTPPDLSQDAIRQCLSEAYGLNDAQVRFMPLGADVNSAAFRIDAADGAAYFLKLRRGEFDPSVVAVPAFLHHDQGIEAVMAPLPTTAGPLSVRREGFDWALYPFFDGANGFERALGVRRIPVGECSRGRHGGARRARGRDDPTRPMAYAQHYGRRSTGAR